MIMYEPREQTRNCETMDKLRAMAADQNRPWDPVSRVERAAAIIVIAMTELHGGEWRSQIDHQAKIVAVVPY